MNKFLIATSALFFATQPLKAGWLKVEDDVIESSSIKTIRYNFASKNPSCENGKYTKLSSKHLKSKILETVSEKHQATLLVFSEVSSRKQLDKILGIAEGINVPNLNVTVNFQENTPYEIKNYWNDKWTEVCEKSDSEDDGEDYY